MQGNFTFNNPTRLHFGKESLAKLSDELQNYGPKVMLTYGGGSIKKNGIYDQVIAILKGAGKTVVEEPGVMPNPTIDKVLEGAKLAKEEKVEGAINGLETMESWMRELGLAMNITDCGAKAEDLENYADACPINESGYVTLTRRDVIDILRNSL